MVTIITINISIIIMVTTIIIIIIIIIIINMINLGASDMIWLALQRNNDVRQWSIKG